MDRAVGEAVEATLFDREMNIVCRTTIPAVVPRIEGMRPNPSCRYTDARNYDPNRPPEPPYITITYDLLFLPDFPTEYTGIYIERIT